MNKKTNYIDKEEKEIVESYDSDEWVSVGDEKKEELREAAKNSLLKKNVSTFASRKKIIMTSR